MLDLNPGPKPTELQYNIACVVKVFDITYEDIQGKDLAAEVRQMTTEKMVFLFPKDSTQADLFLNAWLPDVADESVEIGLKCGHPVHGYIRSCLFRSQINTEHETPKKGILSKFMWKKKDDYTLARPHIFVQTKAVEEILKNMDGRTINVTVLAENEEILLDQQQDYKLATQR